MAESECTMYNAKCHYGPSSYGSCYCSANQLLDDMTMMCRDDGKYRICSKSECYINGSTS